MSWLDSYFRVGVKGIANNGVGLVPQPVIDFGSGLTAVSDPSGGKITVTADGSASIDGKLVTALRALIGTAATDSKHFLAGFDTPGDGGQGTFTIVAGGSYTDDGGTVFCAGGFGATESKAAIRDDAGDLDPRWFGARGNGSTDDTTAFTRSVAAATATGKRVFIPKTASGYVLTDQLAITTTGTRISSNGAKLVQNGHLKRGFHVTAADVVIEGLHIYNNFDTGEWIDGTETTSIGINLVGAHRTVVRDCKIENWGAVGVRIGFDSRECAVLDCEIIGIGTAGGLFVGANTCTGIYANSTGGTATDSGLRVEGCLIREVAQGVVTGTQMSAITLVGNQLINVVGQHGFYLGNTLSMSVVGNTFRNIALVGIKVAFAAGTAFDGKSTSIVGNTFDTTGAQGIAVGDNALNAAGYRMMGVVVSGNSISNAGSDGIYMGACDGFVLSDNIVHTGSEFGIRLDTSCRRGVISGNYVEASAKSGLFCNAESTSYPIIIENNYFHNCAGSTGTVLERSGVVLFNGRFIFRNNRVDYSGSVPGTYNKTLYVDAGAIVEEYDNYLTVSTAPPFVDGAATLNVQPDNPKSYATQTATGVVTLDPRVDARTQVWTAGASTVTVQFATASALRGDRFRILKDYTTGGALTINLVSGSRTFTIDQRGAAEVIYNGTAWVMGSFSELSQRAQFNARTDTGAITLDGRLNDAITQVWTAAASTVTVQFATSSAVAGERFRIVKDYTSGGALTINLSAGSRTFLAGERGSAEVVFNGTAWVMAAYSNLNDPASIGNGPLAFLEAATNAGVSQDARTSDAAPANLTLTPQAPYASATGTNRNPTNVIAALAAPTNGGTAEGQLRATRAGNFVGAIGPYPAAATTYGCLWLGYNIAANTGAGSAVFSDGSANTYLNVPTGGTVGFAIQGGTYLTLNASVIDVTPSTLQWAQGSSPTVLQAQRTGDNPAANYKITAQNASSAATGANEHGGLVILSGGARDGAGNHGGVQLKIGDGASVVVDVGASGTTAQLAFFGGTKVSKQAITGALSSVTDANAKTVLTSIIAALAGATGYSLVTDSTT